MQQQQLIATIDWDNKSIWLDNSDRNCCQQQVGIGQQQQQVQQVNNNNKLGSSQVQFLAFASISYSPLLCVCVFTISYQQLQQIFSFQLLGPPLFFLLLPIISNQQAPPAPFAGTKHLAAGTTFTDFSLTTIRPYPLAATTIDKSNQVRPIDNNNNTIN